MTMMSRHYTYSIMKDKAVTICFKQCYLQYRKCTDNYEYSSDGKLYK